MSFNFLHPPGGMPRHRGRGITGTLACMAAWMNGMSTDWSFLQEVVLSYYLFLSIPKIGEDNFLVDGTYCYVWKGFKRYQLGLSSTCFLPSDQRAYCICYT